MAYRRRRFSRRSSSGAYFTSCKWCGERIHMRQMPHGQWVAFDGEESVHKCGQISEYRRHDWKFLPRSPGSRARPLSPTAFRNVLASENYEPNSARKFSFHANQQFLSAGERQGLARMGLVGHCDCRPVSHVKEVKRQS